MAVLQNAKYGILAEIWIFLIFTNSKDPLLYLIRQVLFLYISAEQITSESKDKQI